MVENRTGQEVIIFMANGKDVYYFSHDCNARNDEKILMLRAEHGWEGYGLFWALVEMMFESKETCLHHNKIRGIAVSYNIDITLLQNVINTAINEGLFVSDGERFWSESLRKRKQAFHEQRQKKSEAGKKGMEVRWKDHVKTSSDNTVITQNNKGKESKEKTKESKGKENNKTSYAEFVKMTPEQYQKLINSYGEKATLRMIEILDNYKGSKGKTYKDDYRAILNWVTKRYEEEAGGKGPGKMSPNVENALRLVEKYEDEEGGDPW